MPPQDYVGPYRLLNLIRTGKTCEVWEVMNDLKGERLAIKLLAGEAAKNREEVAFLKHEVPGRARSSNHPERHQDLRLRLAIATCLSGRWSCSRRRTSSN